MPARRRVAARRGCASSPFRERRQPVVLFRYLEQAALILHRICGQSPCPFRALAPVIRIGQKICHRYAPDAAKYSDPRGWLGCFVIRQKFGRIRSAM